MVLICFQGVFSASTSGFSCGGRLYFIQKSCLMYHLWQTWHAISIIWAICASRCSANRNSIFLQVITSMCYSFPWSMMCSYCLECEKAHQRIDIVLYLFPGHPLVYVCICWACWGPQDGSNPLYISAQNGHKEVVEVLLVNGAEVNDARKVISYESRGFIWRIVCQCIRNHVSNGGMALLKQTPSSQWSMNRVNEVSCHELAHPCTWDMECDKLCM